MKNSKFWLVKDMRDMTSAEWESLCDGCGLCCLHKLEDSDTGKISYTNVACRLLDLDSCQCVNYRLRQKFVPDCVVLTPEKISDFHWLPKSCAYRRVSEGKDLLPWHPLISSSQESVHEAGISVQGKVISERDAGELVDHIVDGPHQDDDHNTEKRKDD